jgi:adenosylhomocysteine nucleosidase
MQDTKVRARRCTFLLIVLLLAIPAALVAQPVVGVMGIADEIAPMEKRLQNGRDVTVRGHVFRTGTLNGQQVVVGRSPAGKVNAAIVATVLIGHFNPAALFFSGTAGAVDPTLRPGDVVIGTSVAQHDVGLQTPDAIKRRGLRNAVTGELDSVLVSAPDALLAAARRSISGLSLRPMQTSEGERVPRIVEGVIVTGDVFLADPARRDELRASLGATAIEMEGAAMVQACRQFGVSCLVVRSITDRADGQAMINYREYIVTASENAAAVVAAIITRPASEKGR